MSRSDFPSGRLDQFSCRLPDGLRDNIKEAAGRNGRSMNSELIARLEQSFEAPRQIAPALAEMLDAHIEQQVSGRLRAIAAKIGGAP